MRRFARPNSGRKTARVKRTIKLSAALAALAIGEVAYAAGAPPVPKRPWIGEACKQEFTTLCGDLPASSRREEIVDCLKKHSESLSHDCSEAISDRPEAARTPGLGRGGHRRGRRTGGSDSGGGPYGGSGF